MMERRLKLLVSAYACEPHKGSEPAVGWNWSKQLARFADVWVITRANNKQIIEDQIKRSPIGNLHFVFVDLPFWASFWKRGRRGVHFYYYLWQLAAYTKAKRLNKQIRFDIAHHITFVNDWLPSLISLLPVPFIWGPVGSNSPIPRQFFPSPKYYFIEQLKHYIRSIMRIIDPFFVCTVTKSKKIFIISETQLRSLPFKFVPRNKFIFQQANAVEINKEPPVRRRGNRGLQIFSAGSLIPIKGFHLSIPAFASFINLGNNAEFIISGDGCAKKLFEALALKLNIRGKVIFTGNLERKEVLKLMRESDIFLFPSFERGGMVVLEAMAAGLPVVCLDYGGPGEMVTSECGIKVKPVSPEQTIKELSEALLKLAINPDLRKQMGEAGRKRVEGYYTWDKKGEFIQKVYQSVLDNESSVNS